MFSPPVDPRYPCTSFFTEEHPRHEWSIDPDTGIWIPIKGINGEGQHKGIDFSCPIGTIVHAMSDGIIAFSKHEDSKNKNIGDGLFVMQIVLLEGYDSWILKYSHLKSVCVETGQHVDRYSVIGESGASGAASYPYLHVDLMDLRRQWRPIPIKS